MADLERVQTGQPFRPKAGDWNAFADAARAYQDGRRPPKAHPMPGPADGGVVLVRNGSGTDRAQFDVLALGLPIITPADNESEFRQRPAFEGGTPSVPDDLGEFAVLLEPIPAGKIGRARASGICPVRLYVPVDETVAFADIADGATGYLEPSARSPAQVLWRESGASADTSDLLWALVRLGVVADGLWAEITGGDQAGGWTWKEKEPTTAGGGWGDLDGGRNSTEDGKAYLTRDVVEVQTGTIVRLRPVILSDDSSLEWRFEPPLPTVDADDAYKGLFVNADGRWDRDWPRVVQGS